MPLADCERLVDGWLAQPTNALSSLAFVIVGLLVPVLSRYRSEPHQLIAGSISVAMVLVGIGSVAFHGPGGPASNWIHDGSITVLLVLIVVLELGRWAGWDARRIVNGWLATSVAVLVIELVRPAVGDMLNAPLAFLAVLGIMGPLVGWPQTRRPDTRNKGVLVAAGLVGTGAIIMLLGRTGGPLCVPDAVIQGHAVWHVFAAVGIGVYAFSEGVNFPVTRSL